MPKSDTLKDRLDELFSFPQPETEAGKDVAPTVTPALDVDQTGAAMFETAFENISIGMIVARPDTRFLRVNDAFAQMLGYERQELEGLSFQAVTYEEDVDVGAKAVQALLAGERDSARIQKRYVHKEGHPVWVELNITLFRDAEGEPLHFVAMVQDVSETQRTASLLEKRVRELNCLSDIGHKMDEKPPLPEFLEWVTERVPVAFQYPDVSVSAIEYGERIYGVPEAVDLLSKIVGGLRVSGELVGWLHVAYTEPREFVDAESALLGGIVSRVSSYIESHYLFEQTQVSIQEVRESQETLGETAAELERIFSSSLDMIGTANFDGYFTSLNPAWEQTLGYTREELMAKPFVEFVHPDDVEATNAESAKIAEGVQILAFENRYRCKDGCYKWISWKAFPDLEHGAIHFIARDVTESKQSAEALNKRAREMEAVAEVGTAAATILKPEELLHSVVELTKERFDLYHVHVYLLNEARDTLTLASGAGEAGKQMVAQGWQIPLASEQSLVARAAQERQGVIVNDVRADPGFLPNESLPDTAAEMAVPMIVGRVLLGVMDVQSEQVGRFAEEDVVVMTTLASQVAVALENARQHERTQQALTAAETLYAGSAWIASANSMEKVLQALVGATSLKKLDRANILIFDRTWHVDAPKEVTVEATWEKRGRISRMPVGTTYSLKDLPVLPLLNREQPTVVADTQEDVRLGKDLRAALDERQVRSLTVFPLKAGGEWIGVVVGEAERAVQLHVEEVRRINSLMDQAATVAQNLRLIEQTRQAQERSQTILDAVTTPMLISKVVDGQIVYANSLLANLIKVPLENLIGSATPDFYVDLDDRKRVVGQIQEKGAVSNYELRLKRSDGDGFWALLSARLLDYEGEMAIITSLLEVTERKQAEDALSKRLREMQVINQVAEYIRTREGLVPTLEKVMTTVIEALGADNAVLSNFDHETQTWHGMVGAGEGMTTEIARTFSDPGPAYPHGMEVVQTGQVVAVDDAKTYPNFPVEYIEIIGIKSVLTMPVFTGDVVTGVIFINWNTQPHTFTADEITLARGLSDQISTGIESQRLFEQARTRARQLVTVAEVGTTAATVLDPQILLQSVVDLTKESFELYHAHIYLLDEAGEKLVLTAGAFEVGRMMADEGWEIPLNSERSLVARAARERQGVIVNDVQADPDFLPNELLPDTASEMAVPLVAGDQVLGVLDVQSENVDHFTEEDVSIQTTLASQVAVALQNARQYEQTQAALARTDALYSISASVNEASDEDELLQAISQPAIEAGALRANLIYLDLDESGTPEWAEIVTDWSPEGVHSVQVGTRFYLPEMPFTRLWVTDPDEPLLVSDANTDERVDDVTRAAMAQGGSRAMAVIPLTRAGLRVGLITFTWDEPHEFSPQEAETYRALIGLGSPAIQNRRLVAQTQSALAQTDALYSISSGLNEAADEAELLQAISQPAIEAGALRANLIYLDLGESGAPEWAEIVAVWPPEATQSVPVGTRVYLPEMPFTQLWVANPDEPLLVSDINTDERVDDNTRAAIAEGGGRGMAIIPLTRAGLQVGLITFNWDEPHEFSPQEAEAYRALIGLGSPAVHSRRLFEQTRAALEQASIFRQFADASGQAFGMATLDGNITYANPVLTRMVGAKTADALYGRNIISFYPQDLVQQLQEEALPTVMQEGMWTGELPLTSPDGQVTPAIQSMFVVHDKEGNPLYLATVITDITERKEDEARLAEALTETQAMYTGSARVAAATGVDEVLSALVDNTVLRQLDRASVAFFDQPWEEEPPSSAITMAAWEKSGEAPLSPVGSSFPVQGNPFLSTVRPGQPSVLVDITTDRNLDPAAQQAMLSMGMRGGLMIPLVAGDVWFGLLIGHSSDPLKLSDEALRRITTLVDQASTVMQSLRLQGEMRERVRELTALQRMMSREAWAAYQAQASAESRGYMYDRVAVKPLISEVVSGPGNGDDGKEAQAMAMATALQEAFAARLAVRGEPIGVLGVRQEDGHTLTSEDEAFLQAIAEQVAQAMERARLIEQTQKAAVELQAVADVSTATSTILNPEELLQSVVDLTKRNFGLYHAHAYLLDEAGENLNLVVGAGEVGREMTAEGWSIPVNEKTSLVARVAKTRQGEIIADVRQQGGHMPNPLLPDTLSELAVPMIVGDTLLGVFDVQSDVAGRFTEEDVRIYGTLAAQVAVALQNAELYAEQLETVERLRELDNMKSAFLANMSHELRTPLNSILGFTQVILEGLDGPLTDLMISDLDLIEKNGKHLLNLINDVLDMAKIEAGRLSLSPEPLNVYELLEDVIITSAPLARDKDLYVNLDADHDQDWIVTADQVRMRQIFLNLIGNSIKFTDSGGITVELEKLWAQSEEERDRVQIRIRDTGIGIPPNMVENIFEAFSQVDSTTTRKAGGTGLGLPISRRLVELHGGRLWAESEGIRGEGSVFYLELPLDRSPESVIE